MKIAQKQTNNYETDLRFVTYIVLFLMILLPAISAGAQTDQATRQNTHKDFFIAPLVETLGYGRKSPAFGGGIVIGSGNGVAIGGHLLYGIDAESVTMLELAVFMRFYLQGAEACSGPFVQITAGTAVFAYKNAMSLPAEVGTFSGGLTAGWRFLLGERWYVEPAIRAGYPYIAGAGVSAGFRF